MYDYFLNFVQMKLFRLHNIYYIVKRETFLLQSHSGIKIISFNTRKKVIISQIF